MLRNNPDDQAKFPARERARLKTADWVILGFLTLAGVLVVARRFILRAPAVGAPSAPVNAVDSQPAPSPIAPVQVEQIALPQAETTAPSEFWLHDGPGILNAETRDTITHYLRILRERVNIHAAVVVVDSLKGRAIERVIDDAFYDWKIPDRHRDRSLLLLVSVQEPAARLVVGRDLAEKLSQEQAEQVLQHEFWHAFRQGNYLGAFWSTAARLWGIFAEGQAPPGAKISRPMRWTAIAGQTLFLSFFVAIGFGALGVGLGSRQIFLMVWGAIFGGVPLASNFAFAARGYFVPLLVHLVIAVLMFRTGYRLARKYGVVS
ncbi:MAG: TPM domain-containing protein [Elusimicrobia bacterium]|nr:TPM domain-containing protein [Elusimicrobiota bacterium]